MRRSIQYTSRNNILKNQWETEEQYIYIYTYSWNSMLIDLALPLAMALKAVVERTMVAPSLDGRDTDVRALSTILTRMVWPGLQVLGTEALMHLTMYCLPQEAPLSHTPSPAAANKLLDGNCDGSFPLQDVAAFIQ